MKFLHVSAVKHLGEHRLWVQFNDQSEGEIDLSQDLEGPIFRPLKDPKLFSKAQVIGGTIEWPNGADLAPEFLKSKLVAIRRN